MNIFAETQAIKESCQDKTIYFDLPIDEEYDEGHVLLTMRGPMTKYPTIRVFGERDNGIHIAQTDYSPIAQIHNRRWSTQGVLQCNLGQ